MPHNNYQNNRENNIIDFPTRTKSKKIFTTICAIGFASLSLFWRFGYYQIEMNNFQGKTCTEIVATADLAEQLWPKMDTLRKIQIYGSYLADQDAAKVCQNNPNYQIQLYAEKVYQRCKEVQTETDKIPELKDKLTCTDLVKIIKEQKEIARPKMPHAFVPLQEKAEQLFNQIK